MEKLYIKFEEWNQSSFDEAIEIAKELWYKEYAMKDALKFEWIWILRLDTFWNYSTSIHSELNLKGRWYKEYKEKVEFTNWEEVEVSDSWNFWNKAFYVWKKKNWKHICEYESWIYTEWDYCKRKEELKPKYKVWSYVMDWMTPLLIVNYELVKTFSLWDIYIYNKTNDKNWYSCYQEINLREPTEKELELYFK